MRLRFPWLGRLPSTPTVTHTHSMKKKKPTRRWQKDPAAIYRVMTGLQPFTAAEQATLALPVREALQSLRDGTATDSHWNTLAAITNACMVRGEAIAPEVVAVAQDAQAAVLDVLDRFHRTGKWGMAHADFVRIEPCVDLHEQLIALSTPAQMQAAYRATLERMHVVNALGKQQELK